MSGEALLGKGGRGHTSSLQVNLILYTTDCLRLAPDRKDLGTQWHSMRGSVSTGRLYLSMYLIFHRIVLEMISVGPKGDITFIHIFFK